MHIPAANQSHVDSPTWPRPQGHSTWPAPVSTDRTPATYCPVGGLEKVSAPAGSGAPPRLLFTDCPASSTPPTFPTGPGLEGPQSWGNLPSTDLPPQLGLPAEPSLPNGMSDSCEPSPFPSCHTVTQPPPGGSSTEQASRAQSPRAQSRYGLDPRLIPSAVKVIEDDRDEWAGQVFVSDTSRQLPPLSSTECTVEDRGNASPRFIRCTSYSFPCDGGAAQRCHLPLGAVVTPLARLGPGERPLPVLMRGAEPGCVLSCGGCGSSMCPFMTWQDSGQRFHCPFCGHITEVPWQNYQPTDRGSPRVDSELHPELCRGSYEILETHTQRECLGLLLAVDVSGQAVRGGQLALVCHQLRALLASLSRDYTGLGKSALRVGVVTYDRSLHLYNLSPALSRPHMLVVTETEDLELPVWEGLLVSLEDGRDAIDCVLEQIPRLFVDAEDTPVSQDLPLRSALKIFKAAGCPGKVLVFHTAPPSDGKVNCSSGPSGFFSSSKTKSLFQPPESCGSLARECVAQGCSLHLFLFSQQAVGGTWAGHASSLTGGRVYNYECFQGEADVERFGSDLRRCVEAETGYRAELRVSVSKGLRVSGCFGAFSPGPDPAVISLAAIDWHTAVAVQFMHHSPLDEHRGVAMQMCLSYTSSQGERRTRVHSLGLRCSRHLVDTFRNSQAETLLSFYCKRAYCAVLDRPLQAVRDELVTELTEALACYRQHCSSTALTHGQLVLPQCLKALPVYVNSLRKSEVLLPGQRSSVPQRLQLRGQLVAMDPAHTAAYFYPELLPLPLCEQSVGDGAPAAAVRCSGSSLDSRGLYLAHSSLALLLWVGEHVPLSVLSQLFNASSFSQLPCGECCLPTLDNPLSLRVRAVIETLRSCTAFTLKLQVVKQGDHSEEALRHLLVEDKSPNGGASYPDFLYHVHINSLQLLA
ncbi:protein transport protein Sec24C isoform X1 [Lepisosteus oculatus]|uniref:protein transport protein Sec24C isoform X1 n=2 Tax=Lepisosteus oculatus TaxID=7918 RepID=UPI0035F51AFC